MVQHHQQHGNGAQAINVWPVAGVRHGGVRWQRVQVAGHGRFRSVKGLVCLPLVNGAGLTKKIYELSSDEAFIKGQIVNTAKKRLENLTYSVVQAREGARVA